MKLIQAQRTTEVQDHATASIALIPVAKMTTELRNWCIWHNTYPDRIVLSPSANGDTLYTYGGDALLLAEYTSVKTYQTLYNDREIEVAIVYLDQLQDLIDELVNTGITMFAIERATA